MKNEDPKPSSPGPGPRAPSPDSSQPRTPNPEPRIYIGVGSNIEPRVHVPRALELLERRFGPLDVSPVYACPAVGFDGPDFFNLVVGFETAEDPRALVGELREIERRCGRTRSERSRSRTMDLDLLLYGDLVIDEPGLRLPRDDILHYAFALKPLADIAPDLRHPVDGRTYAELWAAFGSCDREASSPSLVKLTR